MKASTQQFIQTPFKLDNWSDNMIKNSLLVSLILIPVKNITSYISKLIQKKQEINLLFLILLISIYALFASLSFPQFSESRFGIGLIIFFCFLIFMINIFSGKILEIRFNILDFVIIVFMLTVLISTFSSYFFKESIIGLLKYIVFFICYLLLKFTVLNTSNKSFLNLWHFLFICAVITASIGIYQYLTGTQPLATWDDSLEEDTTTRSFSTIGNPNLLAGYLLLILPIGIFLPFEIKVNLLSKALFFTGAIFILCCIIFTGSRGGYLGLITGTIYGMFVLLNSLLKQKSIVNRTFTTIIIASGVGVAFYLLLTFMFPNLQDRIATIFSFRDYSTNNFRINIWSSCLNMLKDNWIIGIGPGNVTFRLAYGIYMISGFDALAAYNIFLEIAIETGIIGFLAVIFIFILSFIKLHYLYWEKKSILALGVLISLIMILVQGMVDTVLFRPQIFVPFWLLLASIGKLESES